MSGRPPERWATAPPAVGDGIVVRKTIRPEDVERFAAASGDRHPIHFDDAYARASGLRSRVVHGALLVGLMSAAATALEERSGRVTLSYGYDRLRFVAPVHVGEEIATEYRIEEVDTRRGRTIARCKCTNASGRVVAVGYHVAQLI
jgi:3-hydroxybutyryl-CoA dehydratase